MKKLLSIFFLFSLTCISLLPLNLDACRGSTSTNYFFGFISGVNNYQEHIKRSEFDAYVQSGGQLNVYNRMEVSLPITLYFNTVSTVLPTGDASGSSYQYYTPSGTYSGNSTAENPGMSRSIICTALYYKIIHNLPTSGTNADTDTSWHLLKKLESNIGQYGNDLVFWEVGTYPSQSPWLYEKSHYNINQQQYTPIQILGRFKNGEFVKLFGDNTLTKEIIEKNGDTIEKGDYIIFAWYILDINYVQNLKAYNLDDSNYSNTPAYQIIGPTATIPLPNIFEDKLWKSSYLLSNQLAALTHASDAFDITDANANPTWTGGLGWYPLYLRPIHTILVQYNGLKTPLR